MKAVLLLALLVAPSAEAMRRDRPLFDGLSGTSPNGSHTVHVDAGFGWRVQDAAGHLLHRGQLDRAPGIVLVSDGGAVVVAQHTAGDGPVLQLWSGDGSLLGAYQLADLVPATSSGRLMRTRFGVAWLRDVWIAPASDAVGVLSRADDLSVRSLSTGEAVEPWPALVERIEQGDSGRLARRYLVNTRLGVPLPVLHQLMDSRDPVVRDVAVHRSALGPFDRRILRDGLADCAIRPRTRARAAVALLEAEDPRGTTLLRAARGAPRGQASKRGQCSRDLVAGLAAVLSDTNAGSASERLVIAALGHVVPAKAQPDAGLQGAEERATAWRAWADKR